MSDQNTKYVVNVPDDASKTVADELAHQLGSDPMSLEAGVTDMRRLSNIYPDAIIPLMYCAIRGNKSRAFRKVFNLYSNLVVSVDGRGRKDIIHMEIASRGGGALSANSEINKPGWFERNITHRNWEEEEKRRLGI